MLTISNFEDKNMTNLVIFGLTIAKIIECENYPPKEYVFALDTPAPIKLYLENKWNPWRLNDRSY